MKQQNVVALRDALQRGVQVLATHPERPLLVPVADNAVLKVEPAEGCSGIPRRTIRRCPMGVVQLERNRLVRAPGPADVAAASDTAASLWPAAP